MSKRCRISEGNSNPIATIEDIQRRLTRPSALHRDDIRSSDSEQFNSNQKDLNKNLTKLEDYLDPYLLSTISSKISKQNTNSAIAKRSNSKYLKKEFEWPVDELKSLMEGSRSSEKTGTDWRNIEAVNLKDDCDLAKDVEDEEDEESCTPFLRFEKTALKLLFKG